MLQTLRRLSDQASYYWQKDVVGYDQDKQADSLLKWFNISSIMQQIIWLAASAVIIMATLVFIIWRRRRKRWHPADLPLAQLSKRIGKRDKLLAREDHEGQLAWLERLTSAIDSRLDGDTHRNASHLTDSEHPIAIQIKLIEIRQNYRQLRYGRLSTFDSSHSEYQERLKQLKKDVRALL